MIKPIPTQYGGRTFRSRIEARWAIFFDLLLIDWHYEAEGFELPSGRYLPDFLLPGVNGGSWFEVKGAQPTDAESRHAFELAEMTGQHVYIAWGQMPANIDPRASARDDLFDIELFDPEGWDNYRRFCLCPVCGKVGLEYYGRGERVCEHGGHADCETWGSPIILRAHDAARLHSFWEPR